MKKLTQTLTAIAFFLSGGSILQAQQIPTLENVVYGGLIHTKGSTYVNWLEDGDHYSRSEKNPAGGYDIIAYPAKGGKRETLIHIHARKTGNSRYASSTQLQLQHRPLISLNLYQYTACLEV